MILHIGGIPSAGKSPYCRWLAQEKDYVHFDIDRLLNPATVNDEPSANMWHTIEPDWNAAFASGAVEPFVESMRDLRHSVVLDWGFPTQWLDLVRHLRDNGVRIWWFDADINAAREKFKHKCQREFGAGWEGALQQFENQVNSIERVWPRIAELYSPHILKTLGSDGVYMASEGVFRRTVTEGI